MSYSKTEKLAILGFPQHLTTVVMSLLAVTEDTCTHCGRSYRPHHGNSVSFFSPPTLVFTLSPIHRHCSGVGIIQTEEKRGLSDTCPRRRPRVLKENQAWVLETRELRRRLCNIEEESTHPKLRTCVCSIDNSRYSVHCDKPLSLSDSFLNYKMRGSGLYDLLIPLSIK